MLGIVEIRGLQGLTSHVRNCVGLACHLQRVRLGHVEGDVGLAVCFNVIESVQEQSMWGHCCTNVTAIPYIQMIVTSQI